MAFPILPSKYYLTHFFEFIDFLEAHYEHIYLTEHKNFLRDFRNLSEEAQCLYVRMINRKGDLFSREDLKKYEEIENSQKALSELEAQGFATSVGANEKIQLIDFLTKSDLRKWLELSNLKIKLSASGDELRTFALANAHSLDIAQVPNFLDLILQKKTEELRYLLFLYFGNIQKSLSLYALRDLGIREINQFKNKFKPRFARRDQAQNEYFFALKLDSLTGLETLEELREVMRAYQEKLALTSRAQNFKDSFLLEVAALAEDEDIELALSAWRECWAHPARERRVRVLYGLERRPEAQALLEEILAEPRCDEELLFAEDFLARKYNKKKVGYLSEILHNAREVTLSDYYLKRPEEGVCDLYRKQGDHAFFTENVLWNELFGVLFWEELFENEDAAIFNPFDRSPMDLIQSEFYQKNLDLIEKKLSLLREPKKIKILILQSVVKHGGKLNDIFQWHADLAKNLINFVQSTQNKDVAHVLRTMCQKYETTHSGFPDLMIEKNGEVSFVEVKAEGDTLRSKQLSKARLLKDAGFSVEVLKVRWKTDDDQVYVVVDVETTGGPTSRHRVTEVGAVKVQGGVIVDEFQSLINPERVIPQSITRITGITNAMVVGAPTFAEIADSFEEFTKGAIFVAHNVRFDYGFIQREFQRLDKPFVRPMMCTCSGMRKSFPGIESYSLKTLTDYFEIPLQDHHRALCDAKAAAELLLMMNGRRRKLAAQNIESVSEPGMD